MSDKSAIDRLYSLAENQAGYFTTRQAEAADVSRGLLAHHAEGGGSLIRVGRGLYRLKNFPPSDHEEIVSTWLAVGEAIDAVISHDTALELYGLSDLIPSAIHMTVAREKRGHRTNRPGVRVHYVEGGVPATDRDRREGMPITSAERTLLDSLAAHGVTEQTELALSQALARGLTTLRRVRNRAAHGSKADQERLSKALSKIA